MKPVAMPVSCQAWRLGVPLSNWSFATEIMSTATCWAHFTFWGTRQLSMRENSSGSSLNATRKLQGCALLLEGAQRAASRMLRSCSRSTGFGE
jgi:hypothetical protein